MSHWLLTDFRTREKKQQLTARKLTVFIHTFSKQDETRYLELRHRPLPQMWDGSVTQASENPTLGHKFS